MGYKEYLEFFEISTSRIDEGMYICCFFFIKKMRSTVFTNMDYTKKSLIKAIKNIKTRGLM